MVDPRGVTDVDAGTVVVVVAAVVLVAAQAGVVAFVIGFGPFDRGVPDSGPATTPEPTGPDGDADGSGGGSAGSGSSGSGDGAAESRDPPYEVDVLGTERCGNTCRDVTVRLTNHRNATANDVVVTTRIYSGNTTDGDARVWEGRREVGTLEAGASTTATARVSLSYFEALSVERKGGWVTVVTTVESDSVTRTFRERRRVA